VLAHFFTTDEDLTPNQGVGVLLGFAGLMVLMAPELAGGMQATSWGLLAMIVASFSYGVAIVYARRNLRGLPPLVAPAAQLSMATLYLVPLSLFIERPYTLAMPSWPAIGSLFTLAAFGTALAFVIYYRIMEQASATSLSMVTYMVPIVGTVLGVVVLNEQLGWNVYAGCALILLGVMIVNGVFRLVGWQRLTNLGARP
jgi:drug/metabolite transporter (DMT)-like permease